MTDEETIISSALFREYLDGDADDYDNWFMVNPVNGDIWVVPVKDLDILAFESGCIIPHKMGWYPDFDGGYNGCISDSGDTLKKMQVMVKGSKVVPGPSWKWGSQGESGVGTVTSGDIAVGSWPWVRWPDGSNNDYRWAYDSSACAGSHIGVYDLKVVSSPSEGNISLMDKYRRVRIGR